MSAETTSQPFTYLSIPRESKEPYKSTRLYRFHRVTGQVEHVTNVDVYATGYDAIAYRPKDGLLYAMDVAADMRDKLVVINPVKGAISTHHVRDVPSEEMAFALGDVAPDGDTYVVCCGPTSPTVEIDLTRHDDYKATSTGGVPGSGGDYDWAFHPKDELLYAIDGDTGDLLRFDLHKQEQRRS